MCGGCIIIVRNKNWTNLCMMALPTKTAETEFASTLSTGSGEDFETFCQPCDRDDIRLPAFGFCTNCAEHLCQYCFNHHKRAKPSSHHILLDKHNMPQTQQIPTQSVDAGPSVVFTTPCHKHTKERIKFYCNDHKVLICSVCVALDHPRTFCLVNYIPDISKQSLSSKEYTDTLKDMKIVIEKYKKRAEMLEVKITSSNKSLKDVLVDIKKFRQEINHRLDELEKEIEERAKSLQEDNDKRLKTTEAVCKDVTRSIQASYDAIKQFNTSNEADRHFIELKSAKQLVKDKMLLLLALPEDVKEYKFQPNPEISLIFQKETSLGTLTSESAKSSPNKTVDISLPQLSHHINVKNPEEKSTCFVSGMVLHTPSKLILTDSYNHSVKMFDLNTNCGTDLLKLHAQPWDVTSVTTDQVAVTLPEKKTIQFVSASSNKLSLKHKIKVDAECIGISCYQEKLAVTFLSPKKLQILDLQGKVLATVTTDSGGKDIFIAPNYVTSNSHSVYVSDQSMFAIIRLNWQGELIGRYDGTSAPQGLAVLQDGSLLACEYWDGNIKHISADLSKGCVVLRDLKRPETICCCGTNNKLFISCDSKDEKGDNFIHVFNMT